MKRYFNTREYNGIETVDELDSKDFNTNTEFYKEVRRLLNEYSLTGMVVYTSSRCTKEWRTK